MCRRLGESLRFVRIRNAQLAAIISLTAGDEVELDDIDDRTLGLRRPWAVYAKPPLTGYGARPSWAMNPSWS